MIMATFLRLVRRNRALDIIIFAVLVLGILAIIRFLPEPDPVEVSGYARVIDGDSLHVRGVEVRLRGIDAPESEQFCTRARASWPCGAQATRKLRNKLRGRVVTCKGYERDAYDRLLAICSVKGIEINRWLVEQGWAVSYHGYSGEERIADKAKRGIWSGKFIHPRDWRDGSR
jgi:endonuclease YncB( thermonuclease family)